MKKIFIIYLCSIIGINSFGQVSIGSVLKPDSNVILDLTNFGNKGLLLPNLGTGPKKPLGNIFYNNSKNMIGVVVDTTVSNFGINYLSPWSHTDRNLDVTYSDTGKIIINYTGSYTDKVVLEVNNGDVNVADGKIKEYGHDLVPQGAIIMWSGAINDIPPGWSLCDGTNANKLDGNVSFLKPNLMERFIVGAGGGYDVDSVGGSDKSVHKHPVDPGITDSSPVLDHNHGGTTGGPSGTRSVGNNQTGSGTTVPNTAHTHTLVSDGAHAHTVDIAQFNSKDALTKQLDDTYDANKEENRPLFFALAFIIKL